MNAPDDLVRREFTAAGHDQLWLTDLTEHDTAEGQAEPLRDQGRVVEPDRRYSIVDRMESAIAVHALGSAVTRRGGNA